MNEFTTSEGQVIRLGKGVAMTHCGYPGCGVLLIYEAVNPSVWDGQEFWSDYCTCDEEDKERLCETHQGLYQCENCVESE